MIVNGHHHVARTSRRHAWVNGIRHAWRWEGHDDGRVAVVQSLLATMRVDALPKPLRGWQARVAVNGHIRHFSEHASAAAAERACARALRRAVELADDELIPPPVEQSGGS